MEEISIKELINYFFEKRKLIIFTIIFMFIVGLTYSVLFTGEYISRSKLTLSNISNNGIIQYSQYPYNEDVLSTVISNLKLSNKTDELRKMIKVDVDGNSIIINVSNKNSNLSSTINNSIVNCIMNKVGTPLEIEIIYSANPPSSKTPILKNCIKTTIIFIILGVFMGLGISFILFYFDDTIKSCNNLENKYKFKIYGILTNTKKSYKLIKNNIQLDSYDKDKKIISISSIYNDSIKYAKELAKEYINLNKKVIIISCNINNEDSIGYSNYINEKIDLKKCISKLDNIDYISCGNIVNNQVEVLTSDKNSKLFNELKDIYDIVIINCPPILGTTGTTFLIKNSDINLLVLNNNVDKYNELDKVYELYKNDNVLVNGVIVDNVSDKNINYPKYYIDSYY